MAELQHAEVEVFDRDGRKIGHAVAAYEPTERERCLEHLRSVAGALDEDAAKVVTTLTEIL